MLPAPTLPPRLPATCPTTHEPGYTPLNAIEWGCPTKPTFTQGLQREDQRKRLIIYMVRYNFIDKRVAAIISNTGTSKKEFTADCDYYERVRKVCNHLLLGMPSLAIRRRVGSSDMCFLSLHKTISKSTSITYVFLLSMTRLYQPMNR